MAEKIKISIVGKDDEGTFTVDVQRPYRTERSEMSYQRYKEYVELAENYCLHKGYEFEADDIEKLVTE